MWYGIKLCYITLLYCWYWYVVLPLVAIPIDTYHFSRKEYELQAFSTIAFQQKFLVDFITRWWCTSSLWVHFLLVGTLMISSNYSRRSWRLEVGWFGVSKFVRNQLLGIGLIVDVYCTPWYFDSFWGINSNSVSLISLSDSSKFQIYKEQENLDLWKKRLQ